MVKLSPRLSKIFDFIPKNRCFADIGCDHGYLSIAVAQAKLADRIIAMDINKGPLASAAENVELEGLEDIIELRLSDGLRKLSDQEAEVICICGMGGLLMKRIMEVDLAKAQSASCLILEPQSEVYEFRRFLQINHFIIDDEDIATEENKYYPIIKVHYDEQATQMLSEVELKYGPFLLKKKPDLLRLQLKKEEAELSRIKSSLQSKVTNNDKATPIQLRLEELEHELGLIDAAFQILGG